MKYFDQGRSFTIDQLRSLTSQKINLKDYPHSSGAEKNILIYDGLTLKKLLDQDYLILKDELYHALKEGPGVVVIRKFFSDRQKVLQGTQIFLEIIEKEKEELGVRGDHFTGSSHHERIWNVFEKMLYIDPEYFISYYQNPLLVLICESWLGPAYQVTAQINLVRPGGMAQIAHRDYHLGFQSDDFITQMPLPMQIASQYLTLQGAIAHCDMPIEQDQPNCFPFLRNFPSAI